MPIYEYICDKCGHHLEELQKVSDAPLRDCPACGEPKLNRVVSHSAFHLKGGGWYKTDYKDKPKTTTDSAKDSEAKPQGTSEDKKD